MKVLDSIHTISPTKRKKEGWKRKKKEEGTITASS